VRRAAAEFLLRNGKPRDAEPLYRQLLDAKLSATEADILAAKRGLALALARTGDPKQMPEALQLVGLSVDAQGVVDPATFATAPEGRLAQARVLAASASHALRARAIDLFEALDQKQMLPPEDRLQLARLLHLHSAASWPKARGILETVTARAPTNARFAATRANLLLNHKEVPEAETVIARLEQLEQERKLPAGVLSIELKARALELRGKELQAITLLQEFAQQKDAPPSRTLLLAGLHGRLGNYPEAIDLCFQIKKIGYREEAYGAAIGLLRAGKPAAGQTNKLQRWQEQVVRIEEAVRKSVGIDETNLVLHLLLADLMELQGRSDQVEAICRTVLQKDANNLVALNNLAWLLAGKQGKEQEALDLIQRAIKHHGGRPELLDTRAVAYLGLGMAKEAVRDLEQVVRDAPTPARYFHLTRAHHLAKERPQAQAALQRATELGLSVDALHPVDQELYPRIVADLQRQ
jgi:predicted Zn-dependent protease